MMVPGVTEVRVSARVVMRRLAGMAVRVLEAVGRTLWAAGATSLSVFVAFVMSLGGAAQVAGVVVGTWAAWEIDAIAGRLVLAVGLLFLGGAIGRVVREVRNGSTG